MNFQNAFPQSPRPLPQEGTSAPAALRNRNAGKTPFGVGGAEGGRLCQQNGMESHSSNPHKSIPEMESSSGNLWIHIPYMESPSSNLLKLIPKMELPSGILFMLIPELEIADFNHFIAVPGMES